MFGIDTRNAAPNLPLAAAAGTAGYFISASPALGRAATSVSPGWLNAVQGEVLAVVSAAGLVPDKAAHGQLAAAIRLLQRRIVIRGGLAGRRPKAGEGIAIALLAGDMLPAGLAGSQFFLTTAPAADWIMTISVAGVAVGTVRVPAGQNAGQFTLAADIALSSPGLVVLVCPAVKDATARGIAFLLVGAMG